MKGFNCESRNISRVPYDFRPLGPPQAAGFAEEVPRTWMQRCYPTALQLTCEPQPCPHAVIRWSDQSDDSRSANRWFTSQFDGGLPHRGGLPQLPAARRLLSVSVNATASKIAPCTREGELSARSIMYRGGRRRRWEHASPPQASTRAILSTPLYHKRITIGLQLGYSSVTVSVQLGYSLGPAELKRDSRASDSKRGRSA
jgi:hypothetical protein